MFKILILIFLISCASSKKDGALSALLADGELSTTDKSSGYFWNDLGNKYLNENNLSKADYFYQIALSKFLEKKECPISLNNLAIIAYKNGLPYEAIDNLLVLKNSCKGRTIPLYNLAILYIETNQLKDAKLLLSGLSNEPRVHYLNALILYSEGNYPLAEETLLKGDEKMVGEAYPLLLAKLKYMGGKYIEAQKLLDRLSLSKESYLYKEYNGLNELLLKVKK